MKILHIMTEKTWGGGENQVRLLLNGLKTHGSVKSFVAIETQSAARQKLADHAELIPVRMRNGLDPIAAFHLARFCRSKDVQIIDAHSSKAHSLGLFVKSLVPSVKLVVHRRVETHPNVLAAVLKYRSPRIARYVAISQAIADDLRHIGIAPQLISIVRSAVDPSAYQNADKMKARSQLDIPPEAILISNAAQLSPKKGQACLLRALKEFLASEQRPWLCLIAGDGPCRGELERLAASLGLSERVRFLGFRKDVQSILTATDIFVQASEWEGLGTIVLEAIHAGNCVLASRAGGIPEIIRDGETGLLFNPRDHAQLASALRKTAENADLRTKLNAAARDHVRRQFSIAAMIEGNFQVYQSLLS